MKAYSIDLRERIVTAVEQGNSVRSVARRFAVSPASVSRYVQQKKQHETLAPKKSPGSKQRLDEATVGALLAQVEEKPDQTLHQLHQWLTAWLTQHYPDIRVSLATVHRALLRAGLTYKKRHWSRPNETTRNEPHGGNL